MSKECIKCHAVLDDSAVFCEECGEEQPKQSTKSQTRAQTKPQAETSNGNLRKKELASSKSHITAGLLAIFLGGIGIHNFYLGYNKKAVIQIVLFVLTAGLSSIWGWIEGIFLLIGKSATDADGAKLI